MDKLLQKFIQTLVEQGKSNSTVIAYQKDIEQLIVYLKSKNFKDFKKIEKADLDLYIKTLLNKGEFSVKTVSRKLNSIKTFFKFLISIGSVKNNASADIRHPKFETKMPRILSKQEYMALRDSSKNNQRTYIIIELLLQTGIRIGELSRLKVEDLHLKGTPAKITITKYASCPERTIEISDSIKKLLIQATENKKNPKDYLFTTKTTKPLLIRNIRSTIDRHFEKAEIENATVNDIRNTFIVFELKNGIDIKFLASYVGHERLTSTQKFVKEFKISPLGNKRKIVEL